MQILMVRDGHWYASKEALVKAKALHLLADPHVTPDGRATLVFDARGDAVRESYADPETNEIRERLVRRPPAFVMQADHGHDLMHFNGSEVARVEFAASELDDIDPLVEFDHLPDSRKETSWMEPGSKLA